MAENVWKSCENGMTVPECEAVSHCDAYDGQPGGRAQCPHRRIPSPPARTWEIREECGGSDTIEADALEDAIKEAEDWVQDGEYGQDEHSVSVQYWVEELPPGDAPDDWEGEEYSGTVEMHPDEPDCDPLDPDAEGEGHDWQRPIEIVGGIKENPGVWGHGGGIKSTSVCSRCGMYARVDTWADDGHGGHMESQSYDEADEESKAWVRSLWPQNDDAQDHDDGGEGQGEDDE